MTPVFTPTLCPPFTPTYTGTATGNSFGGTLTYTGGSTVDSDHPLGIFAVNASGGPNSSTQFFTAASAGYPYQLADLLTGSTYVIVAWYNAFGDGTSPNNPHVGDKALVYGSTSCPVAGWQFLSASGNQAGLDFTFNNDYTVAGIAGPVTYAGSLGPVDSCQPIVIQVWPPGTGLTGASNSVTCSGCNPLVINAFTANGTHYDDIVTGGTVGSPCAIQTVDVLAFYLAPGNACCVLQPGDPYVWMAGVNTSIDPLAYPITITDASKY